MAPTTTPVISRLDRRPDVERRATLNRHAGRLVRVTYSGLRDAHAPRTVDGVLLGAAGALTGAQSSMAVLRTEGGQLVTLSTATILRVTFR